MENRTSGSGVPNHHLSIVVTRAKDTIMKLIMRDVFYFPLVKVEIAEREYLFRLLLN